MKVTADTNILVRAVRADDPAQTAIAQDILRQAALTAIPATVLWELVWVLRRSYKYDAPTIAASIRTLAASGNVRTDCGRSKPVWPS